MTYNKSNHCNCHEKKRDCNNLDLCASMPVSDAFTNINATDRIILSRSWIDVDHCNRPIVKCQPVSMTGDALCDFINDKIQATGLHEIIGTQIIDRGLTIGG